MTILEAQQGLILELLDELPEDTEKLSKAEVAKAIFERRCETIVRTSVAMGGLTSGLVEFNHAYAELKNRVGVVFASDIFRQWLAREENKYFLKTND